MPQLEVVPRLASPMRRFLPLLLLPLLPLAAGHGEDDHGCTLTEPALVHLDLWEGTVAPGESLRQLTAFSGCAMPEGWWLNYWMDGAGLQLTVDHEGTTFGPWPMDGERFLQLPEDGFPVLTIHNPTNESHDFRMYYDHSCDCTGKAVPVNGGGIWFNAEATNIDWSFRLTPVERDFTATAPQPQELLIELLHVRPTADGLVELDRVELVAGPEDTCLPGTRLVACLEASFSGAIDGTQYLWMRVTHDGTDEHVVQVRPQFTVQEDAPGAPLVWLLGVFALVAAGKRYR